MRFHRTPTDSDINGYDLISVTDESQTEHCRRKAAQEGHQT